MPYADLLRPAPNIYASKKLLKSWAQGAKVGRKGAKPFMKSTPGQIDYLKHSNFLDPTQQEPTFIFIDGSFQYHKI